MNEVLENNFNVITQKMRQRQRLWSSGSMTGLRKEIAKHVVLNILETLSEDDFVTIYKFSKSPTPLVECFTVDGRAELVQVKNIKSWQSQDSNPGGCSMRSYATMLPPLSR